MRLELRRSTDLALRVLLELHASGSKLKAADLAERVESTPTYLPQAIAPLVERGWVSSEPGPTGGYRVASRVEAVSVLELVEACEGPTDTGRCVLVGDPCPVTGQTCALHEPWTRARSSLAAELAATPVTDVRHRTPTPIDPTQEVDQ